MIRTLEAPDQIVIASVHTRRAGARIIDFVMTTRGGQPTGATIGTGSSSPTGVGEQNGRDRQ